MVTDSSQVVPVARRILRSGSISLGAVPALAALQPSNTVREHGRLYPLFPWTVSLFVLPVVAASDVAHDVGLVHQTAADWWIQVVAMSIVVALAALALEAAALEVLRLGRWRVRLWLACITSLVFAFGTSAWSTASRSAWQHGPSMLCLTVGIYALLEADRRPGRAALAGFALATAYTVRPTDLVVLALVAAFLVIRRRTLLARFLGGAACSLAPFVLVNLLSYHSLLPSYVLGETFQGHADLATALAGTLVSPARGLLVFDPILLLAPIGFVIGIRRPWLREPFFVLGAAAVAHWVLISAFPKWWGGWSYGPRLFSDVIPFLLLLAVPVPAELLDSPQVRAKAGVLGASAALVIAGTGINAEGAFTRSSFCWNVAPSVDRAQRRLWDWSDPQFLAGIRGIERNGLRYELVAGGADGQDPNPDDGDFGGCFPPSKTSRARTSSLKGWPRKRRASTGAR